MEELPLISVILPVYNTSKYLKKCFDSLLRQTYPNLEFIIVNDASTDNSKEIIKEYLEKSPKFKLVEHEKNRGLFQARLTGFQASKGKYIAFLDSDDCVSADYYRKMYRTLTKKDADICFADWVFDNDEGKKAYFTNEEIRSTDFEFSQEQMLDKFMSNHDFDFSWHVVWNKLIKREVIEKSWNDLTEFSQKAGHLIMCEDLAYSTTFFLNANKFVNCHDVYLYYYKGSTNSTTVTSQKKFEKMIGDVSNVLGYVEEILKKHDKYDKYQKDFQKIKNFYSIIYFETAQQLGCEKLFLQYLPKASKEETICKMSNTQMSDFEKEYDDYEKIISAIRSSKTKVVSFDIFDTLIMRRVLNPTDIFVILGQEFANELTNAPFVKFDEMRAKAELLARDGAKSYEITLDDVYEYMIKHFLLDRKLAEKIKARETELELKFMKQRETGFSLYDIAKINGKKVVFTSDMYLPKNVIYSFLENNGYDKNDVMYLSCERKKSKSIGNLYTEIMSCENVKASQVVHIGDNFYSDYEMASKNGINAFHLPKVADLFNGNIFQDFYLYNSSHIDLKNTWYVGLKVMYATVANKLFDFPFVHKVSTYQRSAKVLGYYAVGMYLYAFTRWVIEQSAGKRCVHFVARDGYVPLKAFEIFREKTTLNLPESDYFFMSRKFLFPLAIKEPKDFVASINLLNVYEHSIKKILSYFPEDCINKSVVASIPEKKFTQVFGSIENFLMNVELLSKCINYKKLDEYHKLVGKFFDETMFDKDMIVDIGYNGRAESILKETFGKTIDSLYVHGNADTLFFSENKYGFDNKCFYEYKPKVTGTLRELIFMKREASFLRYDFSGDKPQKVFDDKYICKEDEGAIVDIIQSNAIEFVKDVCEGFGDCLEMIRAPKMVLVQPWEAYLHNSSAVDKEIFSSFIFEDDIGLGKINMITDWQNQNYETAFAGQQIAYRKPNFLVRLGNKLFPVGTRRRARLKRLAQRLAPPGSKRRKFCKKLIGRK